MPIYSVTMLYTLCDTPKTQKPYCYKVNSFRDEAVEAEVLEQEYREEFRAVCESDGRGTPIIVSYHSEVISDSEDGREFLKSLLPPD